MAGKEGEPRMLEIQHFSHGEHTLRFVYGWRYTCDGCGEVGYGFRYQCSPCNFTLHESCARAPKSISHSCHPQHPLVFREKPLKYHIECDVCREKISGFVYECRGCDIDLHPSCAKLPHSLLHALHPHHTLQLVPSHITEHVCNVCGEAFTSDGMRYRCCEGSTTCDFNLHISCAKLPVDSLEEMRMQSISPLEVPRVHMSISAIHSLAEMRMLSISPLELDRGNVPTSTMLPILGPTGTVYSGAPSPLGTVIYSGAPSGTVNSGAPSVTAAAARSSSSTGTTAKAKKGLDALEKGSKVLGFTSNVVDAVNSSSRNN